MPAAAVIPAPIAYIKVVAVKKLVVGFLSKVRRSILWMCICLCLGILMKNVFALHCVFTVFMTFTLRKLECSRQAIALDTLAWNNTIGPRFYFVGF